MIHTITHNTDRNVTEHVTNDANSNPVTNVGALLFRITHTEL